MSHIPLHFPSFHTWQYFPGPRAYSNLKKNEIWMSHVPLQKKLYEWVTSLSTHWIVIRGNICLVHVRIPIKNNETWISHVLLIFSIRMRHVPLQKMSYEWVTSLSKNVLYEWVVSLHSPSSHKWQFLFCPRTYSNQKQWDLNESRPSQFCHMNEARPFPTKK